MIVWVDSDAHDPMPYVQERRAAARRLCADARARMASARAQLQYAQGRLAAHAEFCRALDVRSSTRANPARGGQLLALPSPRAGSPPQSDGERTPAKVLDFVRRSQRSANEQPPHASAWPSILREILWDLGEQHARPFVERALALVDAIDDPEIRAEAEAMREWLARRPC